VKRLGNDLVYAGVRLLLALGRALPYRAAVALGAALGGLGFVLARRDRRRALSNLEYALPDWSAAERRRVARRAFANLGRSAAEAVRMRDTLALAHVTFSPASRVALGAALAQGRGVVFVTAHLGNWELMAAWLAAQGYPISAVVRESYDPRLTRLVDAHRRSLGVHGIPRAWARGLLRALQAGRVVGVLLDQRYDRPGCIVPFLGRPARLASGALDLARRRGVPVVAGFTRRLAPGRHLIEITEVSANAEAAASALDRAVRTSLDQWVWMHDRWLGRDAASNPRADSSIRRLPRRTAVL
jgi:KDO2-lipid IV(A) lauroyltransferase